jgi:DNA-directed RNA polymerase subunit RPC12/RpoP
MNPVRQAIGAVLFCFLVIAVLSNHDGCSSNNGQDYTMGRCFDCEHEFKVRGQRSHQREPLIDCPNCGHTAKMVTYTNYYRMMKRLQSESGR